MTETPMRKRPRQVRSAATIDQLLDSAESVFAEHPFEEVTTQMVADGAAMSIGRLYYWFPDVRSIAVALADRQRTEVQRLFSILDAEPSVSTTQLVRAVVDAFASFFQEHPSALNLLSVSRAPASISAPDDLGLRPLLVQYVSELVRRRVPETPEPEASLVAVTLVDITVALLGTAHSYPSHRMYIADELVYVLCAYLNARYPSAGSLVWSDPSATPVRPSRRPATGEFTNEPVYPPAPGTPIRPAAGARVHKL